MNDKEKYGIIVENDIQEFHHKISGMKIPDDSYVRTWVDRDGNPYKYEFRGKEYQGYHNPEELILVRK